MQRGPSLGVLLSGGLLVWAIACFLLHGSAILMYIGIQAITSGLFAWEMNRIEKSSKQAHPIAAAKSADQKAA